MTRTLTLLRHAKTERGDASMADRDRRLVDRGREDAPAIAAWLADNVHAPDLVLCSTATRARQTWQLAAPLVAPARVEFRDDLYLAEADQLLAIVHTVPDGVEHLMIVGHNAGLEDFAHELVATGNPDDLAAMAAKFPTSGVAILECDAATWRDLDLASAHLLHFMTPRRLDG